jgi:NACHT domain-containing protein
MGGQSILSIIDADPLSLPVLVSGRAGSGKTSLATALFRMPRAGFSIFASPIWRPYRDAPTVSTPGDLARVMQKRWSVRIGGDADAISACLGYLMSMVPRLPCPVLLVIDEVDKIYSQDKKSMVHRVWTTSRNYNVKCVGISQSISQIANRALPNNAGFHIFMNMADSDILSLRRNYSIVVPESVAAWIQDGRYTDMGTYQPAYHGAFFDGRRWLAFDKHYNITDL